MKTFALALLPLCLALAGCASSGRKTIMKQTDWESRVGSYTYEQALAELGKPDVHVVSGQGITAEWVIQRSPQVSFGFGMGTGSYGAHSGVGVGAGTSISPPPRGEYLSLSFGQDKILREWRKVRY